MRITLLKFILS